MRRVLIVSSFLDDSTAGNATVIKQGADFSYKGGFTFFMDNSTAGNGTLIAEGSAAEVLFSETAKAGAGTFIANGGQVSTAGGGLIMFADSATAENGTFNSNGGQRVGAKGGTISIQDTATAAAGIFYSNGTTVDGSFGGRVTFAKKTPTAGAATLIATAGVGTGDGSGGEILFQDDSIGDQARVEVFGNGLLDIQKHKAPGVAVSSLEGDGVVTIGGLNLTMGSNSLTPPFPALWRATWEAHSPIIVLNNTAATAIQGTFSNLADGATVKSGNNKFQASYEGGDGNDLA